MEKLRTALMGFALLAFAVGLSGCARPLSVGEVVLATEFFGNSIDYEKVRVKKGGPANVFTEFGATVLGNKMYFHSDIYADDFSKTIYADDRMLLMHELTHVWQYQNRELNGGNLPYTWILGANEHAKHGKEVYSYPQLRGDECFDRFRFEQQGAIMQAYVWHKAISNIEQQRLYEGVVYGGCGIVRGTALPSEVRTRVNSPIVTP